MLLYERRLEREHGIQNVAEDRRREQRQGGAAAMARAAGRALSLVLLRARQATQRSVKFIRWLQGKLLNKLAEALAVARLRQLYATL